jgi:peptidoglycan hydrolase-like protein with peptidoglycan-binding domain
MTLGSNLLKDNRRLAQCEVSDPAHVPPGDTGEHVRLIQIALHEIDGATIAGAELTNSKYGPSTAAAVLAYKTKRHIINRAYQSSPDNIVGKMTIAALDKDMLALQTTPHSRSTHCYHC